jgi:hypothetical protein
MRIVIYVIIFFISQVYCTDSFFNFIYIVLINGIIFFVFGGSEIDTLGCRVRLLLNKFDFLIK